MLRDSERYGTVFLGELVFSVHNHCRISFELDNLYTVLQDWHWPKLSFEGYDGNKEGKSE